MKPKKRADDRSNRLVPGTRFTERELAGLRMLAAGMRIKEIAHRLGITWHMAVDDLRECRVAAKCDTNPQMLYVLGKSGELEKWERENE